MLKGEFYQVVVKNGSEVRVKLFRGSVVYKAHFPDYPITPGVALVQIAVDLLSERRGGRVDISAARNIKFLHPVIPDGEEILLSFRFAGDEEVTIARGQRICATLNIEITDS